MRYAVVSVENDDEFWKETRASARRIDAGEGYQGEHFSFATPALLFSVYTPNRWAIIEKLQEIGPTTLRGLARAVARDVKRVHQDVEVLLEEGIVERNEEKKILVPFESIEIRGMLRAPKAA